MSFLNRFFGQKPPTPPTVPPPHEEAVPDFPFPLTGVAGSEAVAQWKRLQKLWRADGASAVLIGDAQQVRLVGENCKLSALSTDDILAASSDLNSEIVIQARLEAEGEYYGSLEPSEWPSKLVAQQELGAHLETLSRKPKKKVYIARIPTNHSYEIPAYLKYGGWNECPAPEEHVAMLRYWAERFGSEIYAITEDVIECTVEAPPKDKETSMALAKEQFVYCSDIVFQGTESIELLAASLKDSRAWYFWWD